MNFNGYFTKYLTEILEFETCDNAIWDLDRKYNFVANKLMVAYKAHEILKSVMGSTMKPNPGKPKFMKNQVAFLGIKRLYKPIYLNTSAALDCTS